MGGAGLFYADFADIEQGAGDGDEAAMGLEARGTGKQEVALLQGPRDCGFLYANKWKDRQGMESIAIHQHGIKGALGARKAAAQFGQAGEVESEERIGELFFEYQDDMAGEQGEAAVIRGAKDAAMLLGYEAADFVLEDRKEAQTFGF